MASAINNTVRHFKNQYFADDSYRKKKIMDIEDNKNVEPDQKERQKLELLKSFFESPFKEDRKFAVDYLTKSTRNSLPDSIPILDSLYFDKIFESALKIEDEFCFRSLEIFSNLIHSEEQRTRLAQEGYFAKLFEFYMSDSLIDKLNVTEELDIKFKILEKISWMTTLICFYPDLIEEIINLNLLDFIIQISGKRFSTKIRANAVLALSLLTYHDAIFDELLNKKVIDLVMELCKDPYDQIQVKQYSTLALVHFALNKRSVNFLIQNGVMDLFTSFGKYNDKTIKTNVSWIFLALCNNGITGKQMVESGITKDMFMVSCDPKLDQVRHLVIAGFAELGRCLELKVESEERLTDELQVIKESAIVGMHKNFKKEAEMTIKILLHFTVSESEIHQVMAYWAIKNYIMLNHENLLSDMRPVINAFVNGSISPNDQVSTECANAISFLITHRLVYGTKNKQQTFSDIASSQQEEINGQSCVMDALMHLTGHQSKYIKTRAFSTLSTLSTYCASSDEVKIAIEHDLKLPSQKNSKEYYEFIRERLENGVEIFRQQNNKKEVEEQNQGLFWLLRIAKEPSHQIISEAADNMELYFDSKRSWGTDYEDLNETFYIYVFQTLKHACDNNILLKVLKVIKTYIHCQSPLQKKVINPDTILWLLKILKKHDEDQQLACCAGVTLLEIVEVHQIKFDYQEVDINRKFNKALQSLGVFEEHHVDDNSNNCSENQAQSQESNTENEDKQSEVISKKSIEPQLQRSQEKVQQEIQYQEVIIGQLNNQFENDIDDLQENNSEIKSVSSQSLGSSQNYRQQVIDEEQKLKSEASHKSSEKVALEQEASSKNLPSSDKILPQQDDQTQRKSSSRNQSTLQREKETISNKSMLLELNTKESNHQSSIQIRRSYTNVQVLRDSMIGRRLLTSQEDNRFDQQKISQHFNDEETREGDYQQILRESLIKAFLVIFTNEESQHLLLNQDLIDLAFSCLEFTHELAQEVQQKLAKLISIIYKFPQIQHYILKREVIQGVIHLLTIDDPEIVSNSVKACTYMTQNFNFISQPQSLLMVQRLIPLIEQNASLEINLTDLIFCISNILRGSKQNKEYFFTQGCLDKYLDFLLQTDDVPFIELIMQGIKEVSSLEAAIETLLQPLNVMKIKYIFSKCLRLTDDWIDYICPENDQDEKVHCSKKFTSKYSIKGLEKDDDQKRSILFASNQLLIRNNVYCVIARCFEIRINKREIEKECNLIGRLIRDIMQPKDNYFIFGNILLILESLKDDPKFACDFFILPFYSQILYLLQEYPDQENKNSLMKTFVNLTVASMEFLCETKQGIQLFDELFKFLEHSKIGEEMQESVMWLIYSMVQQGQTQNVVQVCIDHEVVTLISQLINHQKNEKLMLQSMNTLQALSKEKGLKESFNSATLLNRLYQISKLPDLSMEILSSLYQVLANISYQSSEICDFLCQLDFLPLIFDLLQDLRYSLENIDAIDMINEDSLDQYQNNGNFSQTEDGGNQNELNQALFQIIANISNQKSNQHLIMLNMGLIDFIKRFLQIYANYLYQSPVKQETAKVEVGQYSTGNIELARNISFIVHSFTKNVELQELLIQRDIISVIKHANRLLEYEVLTNTCLSIGNLMLSPHEHVRKRAVELGCMEILLDSNEESEFLRIRRICNSVLQQTDPRLFEYNDMCRGATNM